MKDWIVDPKKKALVLEPSGGFMKSSCHHKLGVSAMGACGGCYARAIEALEAVSRKPFGGHKIAQSVLRVIRAEAK